MPAPPPPPPPPAPPAPPAPTRDDAAALDAADPLAPMRAELVDERPAVIYLDGNSLGRLPARGRAAIESAVGEWGSELVGGWERWIDLPLAVGDRLGAALLGAAPGQVAVCDSVTVNLYKAAVAALGARPGRRVVVTDDANFPTDRFVLEGIAAERGLELRLFPSDPVLGPDEASLATAVDEQCAVVCLSHVAYRSGAMADMAVLTERIHDAGALALWDLSHSVGSVPIALDDAGADLAVGCTYKHLDAGPGAPAFLYVRSELQPDLRQPIWGWFGQREQFAMGPRYDPVLGIGSWLTGTPSVLGTVAVDAGVSLLAEAGIERLATKGRSLGQLAVALSDAWLVPLGFQLASPRDPAQRGGHLSVRHPEAWPLCRALIETAGVVPDFRAPDSLRLGLVPLDVRHVDVWDALDRLRGIAERGDHRRLPPATRRVT